jgi:hypothetical protein
LVFVVVDDEPTGGATVIEWVVVLVTGEPILVVLLSTEAPVKPLSVDVVVDLEATPSPETVVELADTSSANAGTTDISPMNAIVATTAFFLKVMDLSPV